MEAVDKQKLQERVKVGLEKFVEAMKAICESARKASESLHNLNEALRNSELGEEAEQKLAQKKEEIVRYATQTVGIQESEILPYLTDEIVLQALCYDFCPATVVDCLITDKNFKQATERYKNAYLAESMKKLGLR